MEKINLKKSINSVSYLIVGCIITAFAVNYILKPNGLITSGITGLAIILEKYININYSYIYYFVTFFILIVTYGKERNNENYLSFNFVSYGFISDAKF